MACVPLIRQLHNQYLDIEIILSTITDTGQKIAIEKLGDIAKIIFLPFDLPFCINKALKNIKPDIFILIETELWPNFIKILNKKGIPILVLNGRISEKSFNGYKKIKYFIKDVLNNINLFCMQNDLYSLRIKELGVSPNKILTLGNIKFDKELDLQTLKWTKILKTSDKKNSNLVIVAGSTHNSEEDLIIDTYLKLKRYYPNLKLIIAPRHPERFKEVEGLIKKKGIEYLKRSEISHDNNLYADIILLDVIGELASVYSICDIAIIGGSFITHGGQNPFEPAFWGKAIVCGPHMDNFPMIEEFYEKHGALKTSKDDLFGSLNRLLSNPEEISSMGRIALNLYKKNMGATEKAIKIIRSILKNDKKEYI
jgi:3-deoxy-D-manno-octulosonic-acid transferase